MLQVTSIAGGLRCNHAFEVSLYTSNLAALVNISIGQLQVTNVVPGIMACYLNSICPLSSL